MSNQVRCSIPDFEQRLIDATDRMLLDWVENGLSVFSGQFTESGEPVMVKQPLSAAHIQAVLKRITQLEISVVPVAGTPTGDLAAKAAMKFKGRAIPRPLPKVSDADDVATG